MPIDQVLCGDALTILPTLPKVSVDFDHFRNNTQMNMRIFQQTHKKHDYRGVYNKSYNDRIDITYTNCVDITYNFIYDHRINIIDHIKWSKIKSLGRNAREGVKAMQSEYVDRQYDVIYGTENEEVMPDKLMIDEKHELNIRSYGSIEDFGVITTRLGSEIHRHGLSHPVTVAQSSMEPGKYYVIDGHLRTYTGRRLMAGEIDGCHLPSNWRVQAVKGKFYEDIRSLEKLALRLCNTDLAIPFTAMSAGKGILQMLNLISETLYKESWEVIRSNRPRRAEAIVHLKRYNPSLSDTKINKCLKAAGAVSRMDDEQRMTVYQAIGAGTLSEQTLNYILDIPEKDIESPVVTPVINEAIEIYREAAKQGKARGINSVISRAARMTQSAVKKQKVATTPNDVLEAFKENVKTAEKSHTYSINDMPKTLSTAIKIYAKEKDLIPSKLCIQILQEYIDKEAQL